MFYGRRNHFYESPIVELLNERSERALETLKHDVEIIFWKRKEEKRAWLLLASWWASNLSVRISEMTGVLPHTTHKRTSTQLHTHRQTSKKPSASTCTNIALRETYFLVRACPSFFYRGYFFFQDRGMFFFCFTRMRRTSFRKKKRGLNIHLVWYTRGPRSLHGSLTEGR